MFFIIKYLIILLCVIIGDTFRSLSQHICEDANRCRMTPEAVKDGIVYN